MDGKPRPELPALRDDIMLVRGPDDHAGWPTYTLHDPLRHRFFRLGWREFEMLARWEPIAPDELAERIAAETALVVSPGQVTTLAMFLEANELTTVDGQAGIARLIGQAKARRHGWLATLLHNYLFFRIPLVRPERFLTALLPVVAPLYSRGFFVLAVLAGALGLALVLRQWDAFTQTFLYTFNIQGMVWYGIAISIAKVVHELGHALTLRRHGGAVPTMGVAFLVMWPVLYTDTASAWLLRSRRDRLAVAAGGIVAELLLAVVAILSWTILPDGPGRTAAFLLATVSLVGTLTINASPLMRFDGYYLLSDWLGIANLQDRSFALARWEIRRSLLGLTEPPPEVFSPGMRRKLVAYALVTWIYRLVLFFGIALMVYHFFFKALGVLLFVVEIGWFILRPIWREAFDWWRRRATLRLNTRLLTTLAGAVGLAGLFFVPWRGVVEAPAIVHAGERTHLYAPFPGRVEEVFIRQDDMVSTGQPVLRLATPELDHRAGQATKTADILTWQIERQGSHAAFLEQRQVLEEQLASAGTELAWLMADRMRATIRAPMQGKIRDLADGLRPGRWLTAEERLAVVVGADGGKGDAFVAEADLGRLAAGMAGRFRPDDPDLPDASITIAAIDTAATRGLGDPSLASIYGGPVAVAADSGEKALIPHDTIYRLQFRLSDSRPAYPQRTIRGRVLVEAAPRSIATRAWQTLATIVMRESGF